MPIPDREMLPTKLPEWFIQITDDGSRTLIRPTDQVAFHSGCGAVAETKHVYLQNSGVASRLDAAENSRVLEIGFGTGMGMLTTVDAAMESDAPLEFVSFENDLLPIEVIEQLSPKDWVVNDSVADGFLGFLSELPNSTFEATHRWEVSSRQNVTIAVGDVQDASLDGFGKFHAVYFDPFAPDVNSSLWEEDFLRRMYGVLLPGGTLTTYCVKRIVRDRLANVGFGVQRIRGPEGGKREVLIAIRPQSNADGH